jgi:hypothetical protein
MRFPEVTGFGQVARGGPVGQPKPDLMISKNAVVSAADGATGNIGWEDVDIVEPAVPLEHLGLLHPELHEIETATDIPKDRHKRGGMGMEALSDRARPLTFSSVPQQRAMNMERLLVGECSRHIAQQEALTKTKEWKARIAEGGECDACSVHH